jgi:hypothetical protein
LRMPGLFPVIADYPTRHVAIGYTGITKDSGRSVIGASAKLPAALTQQTDYFAGAGGFSGEFGRALAYISQLICLSRPWRSLPCT